MFKGGVWILLGRWEGNFTRWDWRGGEGVWILRANVPAGWLRIESVEIWREVTARYFLSCKVSNRLEKSWARKVEETKGKWNWFVLSESTCFCINPFLKWCFCIPEKDLLCRQTDIRHRLRALWGGADRKAFSSDFFFTSLTLLLFWFQLVFCFDDCQNQETVAFYSGLEKSRSTSGKPLWRYFSNRSRRYELFLSSSCLLHWHRFFYVASQLFKTHYCVNCSIRQNLKKL